MEPVGPPLIHSGYDCVPYTYGVATFGIVIGSFCLILAILACCTYCCSSQQNGEIRDQMHESYATLMTSQAQNGGLTGSSNRQKDIDLGAFFCRMIFWGVFWILICQSIHELLDKLARC